MNNINILITGGGLIGGTLALDYATKLAEPDITVYEVDPDAAENLRQQLADKGAESVSVISSDMDLYLAASQAEVVDHCVPIDKMAEVQEKILPHLPNGTVVTNRGSAQAYASAKINEHVDAERGIYHFGIHPVVGRERKPGQPLEIHKGTFEGQIAIMQPLAKDASEDAVVAHRRLKFINEAIGFQVKELPPHIHDQVLGGLSHENTLGLQTLVLETGDVTSGIGATMMRAASGTTGMWSPIHEFNAAAVTASYDFQSERLTQLLDILEQGNTEKLHEFVSEANTFRSEWKDADVQVESLAGAIADVKVDHPESPDLSVTHQLAVPMAVSIARTMGVKDRVDSLEAELAEYGHKYTDILNSSARDSTLAARYEPNEVVELLERDPEGVIRGVRHFLEAHTAIISVVQEHASKSSDEINAAQILKDHIEGATNTMASEVTPRPRKSDGDPLKNGFDPFKRPVLAHIPEDDATDSSGFEDRGRNDTLPGFES